MELNTLETAKKIPFNLDGRVMFKDSANELIHLTLEPTEILEKHTNPFDVIFYVLEGEGILHLEDKNFEIKTNSCFEVKSDVLRGWENISNEKLRILVIKRLQ